MNEYPSLRGNRSNLFYKITQRATKEKVFTYIPKILNGILFRKDLLYNTIHPNEKGHELIAQKILPTLQGALNAN